MSAGAIQQGSVLGDDAVKHIDVGKNAKQVGELAAGNEDQLAA